MPRCAKLGDNLQTFDMQAGSVPGELCFEAKFNNILWLTAEKMAIQL